MPLPSRRRLCRWIAASPLATSAFGPAWARAADAARAPELRLEAIPDATKKRWVARAEALRPKLARRTLTPKRFVRPVKDAAAFQGWRAEPLPPDASPLGQPIKAGESLVAALDEHVTGYLRMKVAVASGTVDAPLRLRLVFAETPAELGEPFDPYAGWLPRSWLQDETITLDTLPADVRIPRRFAFRWVKIEIVAHSKHYVPTIAALEVDAVTSARVAPKPLPADVPERLRRIDEVSIRTLRDCMQTVFEDGPKRDRRLWIGDLRLQALCNAVSFRDFDLVRRSLYLLAGLVRSDGYVPSCAFETPKPHIGGERSIDYALLFMATLADHAELAGDLATARALWPVAKNQLALVAPALGPDGLLAPQQGWWLFVDWDRTLDKTASIHAIYTYALKRGAALARTLGRAADAEALAQAWQRARDAARARLYDPARGLFVSGPERQISWASQAWMILAGVLDEAEARRALEAVRAAPGAVKPKSPYLYHYVLEALVQTGRLGDAREILSTYWGGMLDLGADTFWEVFVPDDQKASPYNNFLVNSHCHAWSCTPAYFLRRFPALATGA